MGMAHAPLLPVADLGKEASSIDAVVAACCEQCAQTRLGIGVAEGLCASFRYVGPWDGDPAASSSNFGGSRHPEPRCCARRPSSACVSGDMGANQSGEAEAAQAADTVANG